MQEKLFNKGETIIRQGELGECFYQILEGAVEVIAAEDQAEKKLTDLKAGDYFGEMAVLEAYPRSATVIALEDGTRVMEIPGKEIDVYFRKQPAKILELFGHLSDRLRSLTADYKEASDVYEALSSRDAKPQGEGLMSRIGKLLGKCFGHRGDRISAETMRTLKEADFTKGYSRDTVKYNPGTVVFREGEPARCLYAIHWGKIGIYADYGTPNEKLLTTLMPGKFFGEMGVSDNAPRSATAVALEEDTTLEIISPDGLIKLFEMNPPKVDMILQNLSYRLRKLTQEYTELCGKISEMQKA